MFIRTLLNMKSLYLPHRPRTPKFISNEFNSQSSNERTLSRPPLPPPASLYIIFVYFHFIFMDLQIIIFEMEIIYY